jgi:hypothetical protein
MSDSGAGERPPDEPPRPHPPPGGQPAPGWPHQQPAHGPQPGYWQPPPGQPGSGAPGPVPPGPWAPAGQPWWPSPPDHPQATTAVVLGIIGVVVLPLVAPFAWAIGAKAVREIDASRGALGGRQNAQIGYVLGIVGTVILGLAVLVILAVIGLFGLTLVGGSSSGGPGIDTWVGV